MEWVSETLLLVLPCLRFALEHVGRLPGKRLVVACCESAHLRARPHYPRRRRPRRRRTRRSDPRVIESFPEVCAYYAQSSAVASPDRHSRRLAPYRGCISAWLRHIVSYERDSWYMLARLAFAMGNSELQ